MGVILCDERGTAGFSWTVDEAMQRTAHALAHDGRVWIIDPVDDPAMLARVAALGEPVAVLQLLDRHDRDCATIAGRLGIPHVIAPDTLADAPFAIVQLTRRRWWRETALWWEAERLLLVPEALGTNRVFTAGRGPLGVHPLLRLTPPRVLEQFAPGHLLVGHGAGLRGADVPAAIAAAIADARRGMLGVLRTLPSLR